MMQELRETEEKFKSRTEDFNTADFTYNIYKQMEANTKHDNIIIKKRIFDLEVELTKLRSRFRSALTEATNKKKINEQCQKMLQSMERVLQFER